MDIILSLAIGIFFGTAQIYLLVLGVRSMGGDKLCVWPLIVQFFCPLLGLLLCAWLAGGQLVLCACVIVGILILGAVVEVILNKRRAAEEKADRGDKDGD
ncbi:MAG: hypothetical protein ACI3VB_07510 [Oscillospiraceae bacterium]